MMRARRTKFIFITGGVVSSLGKGLAAASIGALLENRGLEINHLKLDPYINVDPGTMSPIQHGEVFVTDDGAETDLDLGHYERFTHAPLSHGSNYTSGRIYNAVIQKERRGEYLGNTVQVIPHITDEIKSGIRATADGFDVCIIEVGGTVGDIESLPFLEAIRQMRYDVGNENVCYIHVTLLPYISAAGELKTKPTQHSVMKLREIGIQPDLLICRTDREIDVGMRDKIALFCSVQPGAVFTSRDVPTIYQLPLAFREQGVDEKICEILNIWSRAPRMETWETMVQTIKSPKGGTVRIGVVGKYVSLIESYKSLNEALTHGGIANDCRVTPIYIDSERLEDGSDENIESILGNLDGILVPGGFGARGTEGKIRAIQFARENAIPFFGICLGMQMAVAEFARNVGNFEGANSLELDPKTPHPVVTLMAGQQQVSDKGGTMRLGAYDCRLTPNSLAEKLYAKSQISERHRHRYEVNNAYRDELFAKGLSFSGLNPDLDLVEMIELPTHPYFIACQFHPEFKSKPFAPHPLFAGFVNAALVRAKNTSASKGEL